MILRKKKKLALFCAAVLGFSVIACFFGVLFLGEKSGAFVFLITVTAALLIGAAAFEGSKMSVISISLISVMTALSVLGRVIFYPVAFFKPVCAVVILCGMYLGPVSGMICGGMSAVISGVFFGYGLWLPFQIAAWGAIGLFAGLLSGLIKKNRFALYVYGALSGVVFSAFMDIFTVISFGGGFNFSMYLASLSAALPITAVYAVSNVIFLALLAPPVGRKLSRVLVDKNDKI